MKIDLDIVELKQRNQNPRIPQWLYRRLAPAGHITDVNDIISDLHLNTVCESALCPNRQECWSRGTVTFMILGNVCTRSCQFCAIQYGNPLTIDIHEPENVALAVSRLKLNHVVITSVARDDLPDEGSLQFASTIRCIRNKCPGTTIEVLTPDFNGRMDLLKNIAKESPDIFNHNMETVRRLTPTVRSNAIYERSLDVLSIMKELIPDSYTKSGIMIGLGETADEIEQVMDDLQEVNCDILTIGQYIRPTRNHAPVVEYHTPETFRYWKERGIQKGFKQVVSSPLARSSYHAEEILHPN